MKNNTNTQTKINNPMTTSVQSHSQSKDAYLNLIAECITAIKVSKEIILMTQTEEHYDLGVLRTLHTKLASLRNLILKNESINLQSFHQALNNCLTLSELDIDGYVYSETVDLDQYLDNKRGELADIENHCVIHTLEFQAKPSRKKAAPATSLMNALCYALG